jgi:hypothetical protein
VRRAARLLAYATHAVVALVAIGVMNASVMAFQQNVLRCDVLTAAHLLRTAGVGGMHWSVTTHACAVQSFTHHARCYRAVRACLCLH